MANGSNQTASTASVPGDRGSAGGGRTEETVNLDAPCGALPPHLSRLKNEGNLLFKNGQFADALEKYSQAIQGYSDSGKESSLFCPDPRLLKFTHRVNTSNTEFNSEHVAVSEHQTLKVL